MKMTGDAIRGWAHTRRFVAITVTVVVILIGAGVLISTRNSSTSVAATLTTVADRGTVKVSVSSSGPVNTMSPMSSAATSSLAGYSIYPSTSGQVVSTFVAPGDVVHAGQVIALLADPAAANNVLQAMIGVRTAQIAATSTAASETQARLDFANATLAYEALRQGRKGSVPPDQLNAARLAISAAQLKLNTLRSTSPLPSQIAAARTNVTLTRKQLHALTHQQTIDMNTAQLAVQKAQADLAALLVPATTPSSQITKARINVTLAQNQVASVANRIAVDTSTAQLAVQKAQADFDAVLASSGRTPLQIATAQMKVTLAQQQYDALINQQAIDMNSAQLAVQTAQADLAALLVPITPPSSQIAAAQMSVTLAQDQVATVANRIATDRSSAQLAVQKAQADLAALLAPPSAAQIASAQLDLANAKASYSSMLLSLAPPSRTAVAAARLAMTVAKQKLDALGPSQGSANLNSLQVAVAQSALGLARLQQQGLTVRSPVSGTVTSVLIAPGAQVGPTVAVATVADLKHLLVMVPMSEFDVAHIRLGDRALVDVAAISQSGLPAKVVFVAPVGVNNAGVIQFPVTVSLLRVPTALRPGMLASVQVITAQRDRVVRVSLDAIGSIVGGSNDGQPYVTILGKSGHRTVRFVTLGLVGGNYAQITKGLKGGEVLALPQVISSGASSSNSLPGIGVPSSSQGQGGNN